MWDGNWNAFFQAMEKYMSPVRSPRYIPNMKVEASDFLKRRGELSNL